MQALRPTVLTRTGTQHNNNNFAPNVASIAEQIQAKEVPYCFLIHKNNAEAYINLNCQLLHIYHYIREKFANGETSLGLVNAEKATFLELKNQPGYAYNQLESKAVYLLVRVNHLKNQQGGQNDDLGTSVSQLNVNGQIPTSPGKKFDLEPLFEATEGDIQVLRQISSGKRKRPQSLLHEKNQSKKSNKK